MKHKKLYILGFFMIFSYTLKSQSNNFTFPESIDFVNYLIKNNLNDDALNLLKNLNNQNKLGPSQIDTIQYYIATIYYNKEQFDSAAFYYKKVSIHSNFSLKSQFLLGNSCLKMDSILLAEINFLRINTSDSIAKELLQLQLSGVALLQRNYNSFEFFSKGYRYTNSNMLTEEKNLVDYSVKLKNLKMKSPFIAGSLSAIIPGFGKAYAGKPKQGITAFIPISILGLQAYEAYDKAGIKSPRFIIFGSLFSVFYIGNIWGSVLSVHVVNQEINNEINSQILFNMDIPLHRIFR